MICFRASGAFSLGLERTGGFETVAFCEIEPYPRAVLKKHWPKVPIYEDVRTLTADTLARDGIAVDVICGGFPCQDISIAGDRLGLAGERSGLWRELRRLVWEIRPQFVIVENVSELLGNGMGTVLGDLATIGFDAEWESIPAAAIGAPHVRDRVWIMAYPREVGLRGAAPIRELGRHIRSSISGLETEWRHGEPIEISREIESELGGMAHGISYRVDRIAGLGNAVVPQIPELIGRAILQAEGRLAA